MDHLSEKARESVLEVAEQRGYPPGLQRQRHGRAVDLSRAAPADRRQAQGKRAIRLLFRSGESYAQMWKLARRRR